MKKFLLLILLLLGIGTMRAEEPLQLVIRTTTGAERSFLAAGLSATINNGTLSLTNGSESAQYALTGLDRMWFKGGDMSVGEILIDDPVDVMSTTGVNMGSYANVQQACRRLPAGIYIFKSKSGTFKMSVK